MTKVKGASVRSAQQTPRTTPNDPSELATSPDNVAAQPVNPGEQTEHRKKKWSLLKILRPWAWKSSRKERPMERHNSLPLDPYSNQGEFCQQPVGAGMVGSTGATGSVRQQMQNNTDGPVINDATERMKQELTEKFAGGFGNRSNSFTPNATSAVDTTDGPPYTYTKPSSSSLREHSSNNSNISSNINSNLNTIFSHSSAASNNPNRYPHSASGSGKPMVGASGDSQRPSSQGIPSPFVMTSTSSSTAAVSHSIKPHVVTRSPNQFGPQQPRRAAQESTSSSEGGGGGKDSESDEDDEEDEPMPDNAFSRLANIDKPQKMNNSWNSPVLPPAGYNRNSGAPVANHAHSHSAASAVSPTSSTSGGGSAAGGVKFMPTVSTIGFPAPSGVSRGNVIANRNASGFDQSELQQRLRQRNNKNREQQQQLNNTSSVLNSASRYESRLSENHHNNNNDDDDEELYPSKLERRRSLAKHIQTRPTLADLHEKNIIPLSSAMESREKIKMELTQKLSRRISMRPSKQELMDRNIYSELTDKQKSEELESKKSNLNYKLSQRPTVEELKKKKILRFDEYVHETDVEEYDRRADKPWTRLTPTDKALIRRELNDFKTTEMAVHPESQQYTRLHKP
ncbi:phosphatase and actin regulator 2-like isoform X2 [Symsagittifera roscoffensis]|uniref:phosphatase and actin regulator 2-like isoform X2 n=1 Tax=Symsagittifera roscoffensis TaxID=84072 RepID=UPI00307B7F10